MVQGHLLPTEVSNRPVNVASVPQRSLFRYPGGKTWLVPRVRQWLMSMTQKPRCFVEPFLGGGIISLTVASEDLAESVDMVELDDEVAAVWKAVLGNDADWLSKRIGKFDLTEDSVRQVLNSQPVSLREKAFRTIVKNRVNRGGILAPGAGVQKSGENGKGLKSRWYPATLQKRIEGIRRVSHRMTFTEGDGLEILSSYVDNGTPDSVYFIDPPYTVSGKRAGSRLYKHSEIDHERLFHTASNLEGDFLMTYDNCPEVQHLATRHRFDTLPIAMKNTHHAEMTELLISSNLDWTI
ncbi:MAG: DNA adenine methylase [Dehalococcoidia bacterium]|nr:DNA adenine methylase [Dehalococcoidia bacterium]